MAKKNTKIFNSIALFDDDPKEIVHDKASIISKRGSKEARDDFNKKTNEPIDKKKSVNKNESRKSKNSYSDKPADIVSNKSSALSKTKKETKETGRKQRTSASSVEQKPKKISRASSSDTNVTSKKPLSTSKNRKSDKTSAKHSETKTTLKARNRTTDVDVTERNKLSENREQQDIHADDEIFRRAKEHKKIYTRTAFIQPPKAITGKPRQVRYDLVGIVVDGEYLEVSPWSVIDGMYIQGLDSHYIVKYLYYPVVSTKYDEYDKLKEKQ